MDDSLFQRGGSQEPMMNSVSENCPLFAATPYLYHCLAAIKAKDGKVLKGCSIKMQFYLNEVQICVTDDAYGKYAYCTLDPFKTLPEALEEVLSAQPLNWQESRSKRK